MIITENPFEGHTDLHPSSTVLLLFLKHVLLQEQAGQRLLTINVVSVLF